MRRPEGKLSEVSALRSTVSRRRRYENAAPVDCSHHRFLNPSQGRSRAGRFRQTDPILQTTALAKLPLLDFDIYQQPNRFEQCRPRMPKGSVWCSTNSTRAFPRENCRVEMLDLNSSACAGLIRHVFLSLIAMIETATQDDAWEPRDWGNGPQRSLLRLISDESFRAERMTEAGRLLRMGDEHASDCWPPSQRFQRASAGSVVGLRARRESADPLHDREIGPGVIFAGAACRRRRTANDASTRRGSGRRWAQSGAGGTTLLPREIVFAQSDPRVPPAERGDGVQVRPTDNRVQCSTPAPSHVDSRDGKRVTGFPY